VAYGTETDFLAAAPRFVALPETGAPEVPEVGGAAPPGTRRTPRIVVAVAVGVILLAGGLWVLTRPSVPSPTALPLRLEEGTTLGYRYRSFWSAALDLGMTRRTLRADLSGYLTLHVREVRPDGSAAIEATMRAPTLIVNERQTYPKQLRTTMVLDADGILIEGGTFRLPHGLVVRVLPLGLTPPRPDGEVAPGGSWPIHAEFTDRGTGFSAAGRATFEGYEGTGETIAIIALNGETRASGGSHHPRGRYSIEERVGLDHAAGKVLWLQSHISFDIRAGATHEMLRAGSSGTIRGSGTAMVELSPA